ncbi:16S rRNA (guanine(527)-N(7))-methyltransferase RsmG [Deinococcus metallilatus]|uniref:Ribosomal RNA small subunit methyltransferase G n=1 Tax=Deinococcus metallilatus TaxID=1211322 RepID=A0AAJ5JZ38_9DEIO|nr:16S rRNA (guanine(527)-N(7))-methyltransferase RsmG [Deinococcus metallilatus]MBB5294447.1 16S rRNA (guanine527-N7)-methyltransferase [Deinococcus metallilatus]QBY10192.1 16S rRNA (guanine(527)-N(7))-methyltransferase RsmG [Deinococcus metallilatus]RXJ13918.1 16S rRNA (guanine(527)-N(7))-methyltransferase RsmG [Deinococcus metallilatus]TLK29884.1 16S rRNA (guanine(527)-N(7))-methyltransferase RsmG [Deinococcus metallilatus]GMA15663.1 ribosomal RNA small subunit methyltransferase G [Deinococ
MTPEGRALLLEGAKELGLDLTAEQVDRFGQLLDLLNEGSAQLNLTALRDERDIVLKHFVDSLTCLRGGWLDGEQRVLDLGTGGGFPALPLAIVQPRLQIVPLDATRKKVEFVERTAQALGLENVHPLVGRAENLGRDPQQRERYDRVVTRAVAALPVLAELALPFLRVGGLLVAQKGPLTPEELEAGTRAAAEVGGQVRAAEPFTLPLAGDARTLVIIEKTASTPERYPRREGVPNRKPLFWQAT